MTDNIAHTFSGQGLLVGAALMIFFIVRELSTRPVLRLVNLAAPVALLYFGVQGLGDLDSTGWLLRCRDDCRTVARGHRCRSPMARPAAACPFRRDIGRAPTASALIVCPLW
jgi:hypothetical protein